MKFEISHRGKQYLKTAQTLICAARTMTDEAIANQLKALAEDYELRGVKASHVDAARRRAVGPSCATTVRERGLGARIFGGVSRLTPQPRAPTNQTVQCFLDFSR